jgi:hypothetical protein
MPSSHDPSSPSPPTEPAGHYRDPQFVACSSDRTGSSGPPAAACSHRKKRPRPDPSDRPPRPCADPEGRGSPRWTWGAPRWSPDPSRPERPRPPRPPALVARRGTPRRRRSRWSPGLRTNGPFDAVVLTVPRLCSSPPHPPLGPTPERRRPQPQRVLARSAVQPSFGLDGDLGQLGPGQAFTGAVA